MRVKSLKDEYIIASPVGAFEVWKSDQFWKMAFDQEHPQNKPNMGYLMSQFSFDKDWDSWEVHPNGDEIVFCVTGKIKFILETDGKHTEIDLEPGQYVVVPQNTWHTAKVKKPASALFLTWGYGTKHRKIGIESD